MRHQKTVWTMALLLLLTGSVFAKEPPRKSPACERLSQDGWDIATLDTGKDEPYLTETEKDVLLVMNAARTDPSRFAEIYVKDYIGKYRGNRLRLPGMPEIMTFEGTAAAEECYRAMKKASPGNPLKPSRGISRAAREHAVAQGRSGDTGHTGAKGDNPWDRMNRYGQWLNAAGENISYGYNTGFYIVLQLLIDDGVPDRGHRTNILSPDFTVTGVGMATHKVYQFVTVIPFAGDYREAPE